MSGSVEGGLKAAETNQSRYGENFYKVIGAKGGRNKLGVRRTHCFRGHEFTPENIIHQSRGRRTCRTCHRVAVGCISCRAVRRVQPRGRVIRKDDRRVTFVRDVA